jgi:uncharacterized protein (TIGR00297 family)
VAAVGFVIVFNVFALPRLGGDRFRRPDEAHTWHWGAVSFPSSVLLLLLLLPHRPEIVAAVWALIAVGDSAAGMLGSAIGSEWPLAWNPRKSWVGSLAYVVVGGGAAVVAMRWLSAGPIELFQAVVVCGSAATVAAIVESTPGLLDDNLMPALVAALAVWSGLELHTAPLAPLRPGAVEVGGILALHGLLGWLLFRLGAVDRKASIAGAALGALVWCSLGWRGWLPLAAMIGASLIATRVALWHQVERGPGEQRGGRRSAGQITAKGGWAAGLACLAGLQPDEALWPILFAGALAAAAADTLATELGSLSAGRTLVLWRLRRGPAGTAGGVSLVGTAAAVAGAVLVAGVCAMVLLSPAAAASVALAGILAAILESLYAPPLEAVGLSTHTLSNLLLTMTGAVLAGLLTG